LPPAVGAFANFPCVCQSSEPDMDPGFNGSGRQAH
jgi:hypothetical protein